MEDVIPCDEASDRIDSSHPASKQVLNSLGTILSRVHVTWSSGWRRYVEERPFLPAASTSDTGTAKTSSMGALRATRWISLPRIVAVVVLVGLCVSISLRLNISMLNLQHNLERGRPIYETTPQILVSIELDRDRGGLLEIGLNF